MSQITGIYAYAAIELNDGEYTVTCFSPEAETEYFTDDLLDAEITARAMVEEADKICKKLGLKEEESELIFLSE